MEYFVAFLEGIITFISPCLLPMLPVYISYFAGGSSSRKSTVIGSLGFVAGFSTVFVLMGALAGVLGSFLVRYRMALNIITGGIVVIFGLGYLGLLGGGLGRFMKGSRKNRPTEKKGFFSSFLLGTVFSVGWTPCVGAFLGSALMLASSEGQALKGIFMLCAYSLGLGIPFVISAVLIDSLKDAFTFIKKNYKMINTACGILLIIIGIAMMTGLMEKFLSVLS